MAQCAFLEQGEDLTDQALEALDGGQSEDRVGDALVCLGNPLGVAQIRFPHLDETAAPGQQAQRGVGELPRQRVEHDVHPLASGLCQERLFEAGVTRGGQVIAVDAHRG